MLESHAAGTFFAVGCGVILGYLMKTFTESRMDREFMAVNKKESTSKKKKGSIEQTSTFSDGGEDDDEKMVLVVQNGLKMNKGKIGAQCAHAAVQSVLNQKRLKSDDLKPWLKTGQKKVVVKVDSEEELLQVEKEARNKGLATCIIQDAGRTQVPRGSKTVLAIGPSSGQLIDLVSGHLKLL